MRICFVSPYSPKQITGVGKFVNELRKSLKARGIESIVITVHAKPEIEVKEEMIEINCEHISRFKDIYLSIKTIITIFKLRKKIDVLHLQTPLPQSAFSAVMGRFLDIPIVTTIHGVFPESKSRFRNIFYRLMSKITFLCSDEIIFVSEGSKEYYNILKSYIILNGIDINHFNQNNIIRETTRTELNISDKIVFLFVGRITPTKGIEEILQATSIAKDIVKEDIKVLIVGPVIHKEMPRYQHEIRDANVDNYVINLGVQKNVKKFYCASDVFLLPSHFEGLPLVLLEAMACGLPVVASRVGEIPNIIENHKNGLLVEPRNVGDLVEKMTWCINNKEKLPVIGEKATKTIREKYSLYKMTEVYISIYEHILSRSKR